jgi:putative transposase
MAIFADQSSIRSDHHYSDQRIQYACEEYITELKNYGFEISMSRTGNPYDNARMESYFKTLKNEEVYLCEFETYEDVMERIPYFLEAVNNQKRLHSGIGYLTLEENEQWLLLNQPFERELASLS